MRRSHELTCASFDARAVSCVRFFKLAIGFTTDCWAALFNSREYPRFTKHDLNVLIRIQEMTAMKDMRSLVDATLYILRRIRSDRDLGYNVLPIVAILVPR